MDREDQIRPAGNLQFSTYRWDIAWGPRVDLNPSWRKRTSRRFAQAWAVLIGRKRAYSDQEITDLLDCEL